MKIPKLAFSPEWRKGSLSDVTLSWTSEIAQSTVLWMYLTSSVYWNLKPYLYGDMERYVSIIYIQIYVSNYWGNDSPKLLRYLKPLPTKTWIIVITDWKCHLLLSSHMGLLFISKNIGRLKIKAIITNVKVLRSTLLAFIRFWIQKRKSITNFIFR